MGDLRQSLSQTVPLCLEGELETCLTTGKSLITKTSSQDLSIATYIGPPLFTTQETNTDVQMEVQNNTSNNVELSNPQQRQDDWIIFCDELLEVAAFNFCGAINIKAGNEAYLLRDSTHINYYHFVSISKLKSDNVQEVKYCLTWI